MAKKSQSFCKCQNGPICGCGICSLLVGIGVGALATYPVFGTHPVKWGLAFIVAGLAYYFYSKGRS